MFRRSAVSAGASLVEKVTQALVLDEHLAPGSQQARHLPLASRRLYARGGGSPRRCWERAAFCPGVNPEQRNVSFVSVFKGEEGSSQEQMAFRMQMGAAGI